jgi:hypothetical protein
MLVLLELMKPWARPWGARSCHVGGREVVGGEPLMRVTHRVRDLPRIGGRPPPRSNAPYRDVIRVEGQSALQKASGSRVARGPNRSGRGADPVDLPTADPRPGSIAHRPHMRLGRYP